MRIRESKRKGTLMTTHTGDTTCHFLPCALDPRTPESDYEIHLHKTHDPAYNEAWPLCYQVIVDALNTYPEAHQAVRRAVTATTRHSPPAERTQSLPRLDDLGSRI
jgi:hypothetical protein